MTQFYMYYLYNSTVMIQKVDFKICAIGSKISLKVAPLNIASAI